MLQADPDQWLAAVVEGWSAGAPPPAVLALRDQDPEWDFMARTFLVLALAESWPDEGWTFCQAMALVGLRMHEVLDGGRTTARCARPG